jgi:hypothetical protein
MGTNEERFWVKVESTGFCWNWAGAQENAWEQRKIEEMAKVCSIEGCDSAARARGWCAKHWRRWRTYGNPTYAKFIPIRGGTDEERFWPKVQVTGFCWVWTGATDGHMGHGMFNLGADKDRRAVRAHRFSYETLVGPIPAGLEPDHLCRNPPCVNPDHLELVTHAVNMLRGFAPSIILHRQGTCAQGHNLSDDEAVYINPKGRRQCLVCIRERDRRYRERKRKGIR